MRANAQSGDADRILGKDPDSLGFVTIHKEGPKARGQNSGASMAGTAIKKAESFFSGASLPLIWVELRHVRERFGGYILIAQSVLSPERRTD